MRRIKADPGMESESSSVTHDQAISGDRSRRTFDAALVVTSHQFPVAAPPMQTPHEIRA
jgi:hypothetical protein